MVEELIVPLRDDRSRILEQAEEVLRLEVEVAANLEVLRKVQESERGHQEQGTIGRTKSRQGPAMMGRRTLSRKTHKRSWPPPSTLSSTSIGE